MCKTGLINFSLEDDEVVALSIALENCFPSTFFTAWNEREGGGVGREHVGTLACREHRRYTVGKTRVGHNHLEP